MEGDGALGALEDDPRVQKILSLQRELTAMNRTHWAREFSVSRWNRLCGLQSKTFARMAGEPALLRFMLTHADPRIGLAAAFYCGWHNLLFDEAEAVAEALAGREDEVGKDARQWFELRAQMIEGPHTPEVVTKPPKARIFPPPPPSLSREDAITLIHAKLLHRAEDIIPLLRRAVGLWPQALPRDPLSSRLGGRPVLGKGRRWPQGDGEPLVFIGQINLLELHAAVGETRLPKAGVLQVFGHPDDLSGCFPTFLCDVVVRTDLEGGARRAPPEGVQELISCGLAFREMFELPHPLSADALALGLTAVEAATYGELIVALTGRPVSDYSSPPPPSKLFGWPDLLQEDWPDSANLLMQIGEFTDGISTEGWGPGGTVYVVLNDEEIRDGRFVGAEVVVQVT